MLVASQSTDVSKLAGAMAARLRASEKAAVRSVGPLALERAMKALLRARHWLREAAFMSTRSHFTHILDEEDDLFLPKIGVNMSY